MGGISTPVKESDQRGKFRALSAYPVMVLI